ncbi:MAG: hypothetical protein QXM52_02890, partial [Candidatus Bathyarchaeia archaeon]
MKATIIHTLFGVIAFDEEKKLIANALFPKKPEEAAKTIMEIESGKVVKEVADLVNHLKNSGYTSLIFENALLAEEVKEKFGVAVEAAKVSEAGEILRSNMEGFAIETGFVKDYKEFRLWTRKVSMEIAKLKVKRAVEKKDLIIAQAI